MIQSRKKDIIKKDLLSLIQEGFTIRDIAKIYDCSIGTIRYRMKIYNINTPKGFYSNGKKRGRPKGFKMSKEQKEIRSKKFSGEGNPFYGKKHSQQTKQKMSDNHADFTGDKNPFKKACIKNPALIVQASQNKQNEWNNLSKEERYERSKKSTFIGDLSGTQWSSIKYSAKTRDLEFSVTQKDAWRLYLEQKGKCALSNLNLNLKCCDEITASLDRIDSSKGYTIDNIQWVHKDINRMKWAFSEEYLIFLCQQIINHKVSE